MTAVTTQSDEIVLSEVKDNLMPLEPSYRKTNRLFDQPNSLSSLNKYPEVELLNCVKALFL